MRLVTGSLMLVVLVLGCAPEELPANLGAEAPLPAPPAEAATAPEAGGSPSLADLLTCRHREIFAEPPERQAQRLAALLPGLSCRVEQQGGPYVECEAADPLRVFGLPLRGVTLIAKDADTWLGVDLEAQPATVADAAGRALGFVLNPYDVPGRPLRYVFETSEHLYSVEPLPPDWASYGCTLREPGSGSALPAEKPIGAAAISGRLSYPSEYIPSIRVCAIDVEDLSRGYCTLTAVDDQSYRLTVPPGRWWVLGWPRDTGVDGTPSRYSEATECLAARGLDCNDHRLRSLHVVAGEHRGDIDLLDWPDEKLYPSPGEPQGEAAVW